MFVISKESYEKYNDKWYDQGYCNKDKYPDSNYRGVSDSPMATTYWYQVDQLEGCPYEYISKRVDTRNHITYFGSI